VIKPMVLGGLEAAWQTAEWAARAGAAVVISSAFESSVGVAVLAQLAAAVNESAHGPITSSGSGSNSSGSGYHGLGTLDWFAADVVAPGLGELTEQLVAQEQPAGAAPDSSAKPKAFSVAAADCLLTRAAAAVAAAATAGGSAPSAAPASAASTQLLDVACDDAVLVERQLELQLPLSCSPAATCTAHCLIAHPPVRYSQPSKPPVVLLHGFMGDASDWGPTMRALAAAGHPCMAVDLPGHGATRMRTAASASSKQSGGSSGTNGGSSGTNGGSSSSSLYSLDAAAALVSEAAAAVFGADVRCVLVGYSMGARVALHLLAAGDTSIDTPDHSSSISTTSTASPTTNGSSSSSSTSSSSTSSSSTSSSSTSSSSTSSSSSSSTTSTTRSTTSTSTTPARPPRWSAGAIISGTPGIPDAAQRADRLSRDAELSTVLRSQGLGPFVDWWYRQPLWGSLRDHPRFGETAGRRAAAGDAAELAAALAGMTTGRMVGLGCRGFGGWGLGAWGSRGC